MSARSLAAVAFLAAWLGGAVLGAGARSQQPRSDPIMPAPSSTAAGPAAPRHTNHLAREASPYLLQHAHNPVDWYPWGQEAFEEARRLDRPIFLSVGYSTCYWCHVMERESFEDETVAAVLNAHFVAIKVDREERPDVDEIYMTAVQAVSGHGGWPMSVFLEPRTLKPFFGGTYFPREQFMRLLEGVHEAWTQRNEALRRDADRLGAVVARHLEGPVRVEPLGEAQVRAALESLLGSYDPVDGGFGAGQNKFPMPAYLELLMGSAWDDPPVRQAVLHTLDRMAAGGIFDQVGGGFHRYSTDRRWRVPHFEKMLYDNGQLASIYAAAYERTGDAFYAAVVRDTLDYVLREMTGPDGAFLSAQDAEAGAREGATYIWTEQELREALREAGRDAEAAFAWSVYGLEQVRDHHQPPAAWKSALYLRATLPELARRSGVDPRELRERLASVDAALLESRSRRPQPSTDDKVLTGWNGLMIAGMADGGRVLGEDRYVQAAGRAAAAVLAQMRAPDGGLLRVARNGRARVEAFLEDYALLIRGLVALHRATGEPAPLREAGRLVGEAARRFRDERGGAWFDTLADRPDLFVRTRSAYDGAVPCGNSALLLGLLDLHELTGEPRFLDEAADLLRGMSGAVARNPLGASLSTLALHRFVTAYPQRLVWEKPARGAQGQAAAPAGPVQVTLGAERLRLGESAAATIEVRLHIAQGYHVNAHEPGADFLVALTVRLAGVAGVDAEAMYPPGTPYAAAYAPQPLSVHSGLVTVPLRLRRVGPVSGEGRIEVTFQACTDRACLAPQTVALPIVIEGN
jgi:hypothetical protein